MPPAEKCSQPSARNYISVGDNVYKVLDKYWHTLLICGNVEDSQHLLFVEWWLSQQDSIYAINFLSITA